MSTLLPSYNLHNPCKDCDHRQLGCHSTCKDYIDYKNEHDRLSELRRQDMSKYNKVVKVPKHHWMKG